jgi:molybdopterin synthase catalytic subunit
MIEITEKPISPEIIVNKVKTDGSGCVVTYVGLIRGYSRGKGVLSVEYEDVEGTAEGKLQQIAKETGQKWQLENLAISHRIGKLKVGDINLVVAVASAHRKDGFAACQYVIDRFKQKLPTRKKETYDDGSIWLEE